MADKKNKMRMVHWNEIVWVYVHLCTVTVIELIVFSYNEVIVQ
jgi:hypothetical protein